MELPSWYTLIVVGFVLVMSFFLVYGMAFDGPLFASVQDTGSMEPTLEHGDMVIMVPAEVASEVEEGDLVLFGPEPTVAGDGTVHRVVGDTDEGYVTKGDNNPYTDQEYGINPVTEDQIQSQALTVGNNPVVIPYLGFIPLWLGSAWEALSGLILTLTTCQALH